MSHLGRPEGKFQEKYSLQHIVKPLENILGKKILFAPNCIGADTLELAQNLKSGEILLLENLRFHSEEEKGDITFAKELASLGEIYINDAFGTAHRPHASTSIIAGFFQDKCAGYVMQEELDNAEKVMSNPEKPFTAIMGGAKISDKILIIEKLLDKVDHLLIGGGMSYTFFKALGGNIGKSLVENDKLDLARTLLAKAKEKNVQIHLPLDSKVADAFANNAKTHTSDNMQIADDYMGLDIGPKAIESFKEIVLASKTILWNGPMGVFEMPSFAEGTIAIAKSVVEATKNGAYSLIGGGDSAAAVNQLGFAEQVSYVSTGGGALLEYFEGKVLPGVQALMD